MFKTTKKTVIGQLVSSLSDSDLKDYENALFRWATAIKEETEVLLNENIDHQGARVKILLKMSESEAYRQKFKIHCQILDSCSKYDYETTWKEIRKAGNTALLNSTPEYTSWKKDPVSSTLLWRGKLGAGKSVLLANVIDDLNLHVSDSQTPVAYFFCRHDVLESLKARTVIGSLARQLLRSLPLLATQNTIDVTMPDLDCDQILAALRKALPSSFRAYFVLDGLDECDQMERLTILENVRSLQQMFGLLACLSFRVDASSTQWWLPSMVINPHMVSIPDENPDIACFISSELENIIKSGKLRVGDPAIVLEIEDALLQGSQGMFLWVALQIESLCCSKTDGALRKALADLPKDLPETFARIIQRSGEAGKDYQIRIFKLVVAAFRPLTVEELQEALSVVPGITTWNPANSLNDIYSALACCGGLISINEEALTIKLIHHSVKQYLLGEAGLSHAGLFTMDCAHRAMGEIIITYLNYGVFGTSLSRMVVPEIRPEESPFKIVKSIDTTSSVQALALKYLQTRRRPGFNMGKILSDAAARCQPSDKTRFHFHSYAKSHWLNHVMFVPITGQATSDLVMTLIISHHSSDYTGHAASGDQHLLSWAVEQGNEDIVRLLLDRGADIEVRNPFDMTPLCLAVDKENERLACHLIAEGADVDARPTIHTAPLFLAVRNKDHAMAAMLLSHGANPNLSLDYTGVLRLRRNTWTSTNCHKPLWESLGTELDMAVQSRDEISISPIDLAVIIGDEAMALLLLNPAGIGSSVYGLGFDALEYAVTRGHTHTVKMMLRQDDRLSSNLTTFRTAIRNKKTAIVKKLLEYLPSDKKDLYLSRFLHLAIIDCQPDIVLLLLENGANPNFNGIDRISPLMYAVRFANNEITKMLITRGAQVNARDLEGLTVLSWAVQGGIPHIIDLLVSSEQFDRNQYDMPDCEGRTPLEYAIFSGKVHIIKKLLELGASPHIEGRSRCTPLGRAVSWGFPAVAELLLAHGADPMGGPKPLPLERAIQYGCLESTKLLVHAGALMEREGAAGAETPLASKFAQDQGQLEIARYLTEKGL